MFWNGCKEEQPEMPGCAIMPHGIVKAGRSLFRLQV